MNDTLQKGRFPGTKVAFLLYGYGLGNSPSLINAAKMLVASGYSVDFFICGTFLGGLNFTEPEIRVFQFKKPGVWEGQDFVSKCVRFLQLKTAWIESLSPRSRQVINLLHKTKKYISAFADEVSLQVGEGKYKCFVGVEPLGMMASERLSCLHQTPFVYYNLELHYEPDISSVGELVMKKIEREFNLSAAFTITLDMERAHLIARENEIEESSILTVPVCAEGEPCRKNTNYLRQKLGIAQDKKIVLYAGFLADWAMCEEIAVSSRHWPDEWVLVFHTHGYDDADYINRVRKCSGKNVFFSMTPVDYESLADLLASADVGVALYRDLGVNFTHVASASGKLAHYLKSGLPVVVNDYPSVLRVIDKYSCGVGISSVEQMSVAVGKILANYDEMHEGAFRCYQENYRFSGYFQKVIDRIEEL